MAYTHIQKIGLVFLGIFSVCIVYSLIYKRMYEPFEDSSGLPMKMCKENSDCPDKFVCKNAKCVYNRPLP
jgi:hypothetical protein